MCVDLQSFNFWYNNVFKDTMLYKRMAETVENSPYHRERSVGVHTDMVVTEYLTRSSNRNSGGFSYRGSIINASGAIAAAFHDVGKPIASRDKFTEERGHFKTFYGHEQISARMWEAYAVNNWEMLENEFGLSLNDLYHIGAMIEHHVPWRVRDKRKLDAIILTVLQDHVDLDFEDLILSDQFGRISDPSHVDTNDSKIWISQNIHARTGWQWTKEREDREKEVHIPIGPSGCGKSTHLNSLGGCEVFSLDELRHRWYDANDYANAWQMSIKDKSFKHKAQKEFTRMLRDGVDKVYVDNTNLTRKVRRFYVTEAFNRGYKVVAHLFPSDLSTVVARQETRDDKTVPVEAVEQQFWRLQYPLLYGEADEVRVYDGNMKHRRTE